MGLLQTALNTIFPPGCAICDTETDAVGGLCGPCWTRTPFLSGCLCALCGVPLPGDPDADALCDDCLVVPRPWSAGRAAVAYRDAARSMVLRLKHGDRLDLVRPAAGWMCRAASGFWPERPLLVPVPLHWTRRMKRRYNQAALLAREVGRIERFEVAPFVLRRVRRTPKHEVATRSERFATMAGVISSHPKHGAQATGRNVVLVDDVMTSGATLAACAEACWAVGAADVRILALARTVKDA